MARARQRGGRSADGQYVGLKPVLEPSPQDDGQPRQAPGLTRRSACPSRPTQGRGSRHHRVAAQATVAPRRTMVSGAAATGVRPAAAGAPAQEATLAGDERPARSGRRPRRTLLTGRGGFLRGAPTKSAGRAGGSGAALSPGRVSERGVTDDELRPAARVCGRP